MVAGPPAGTATSATSQAGRYIHQLPSTFAALSSRCRMAVSCSSAARPTQGATGLTAAGHYPASASAHAKRQTHQRVVTSKIQAANAPPPPACVVGGSCRRRRRGRQARPVAAAAQPCLLLTGPDGEENLEGLQLLAAQVSLTCRCAEPGVHSSIPAATMQPCGQHLCLPGTLHRRCGAGWAARRSFLCQAVTAARPGLASSPSTGSSTCGPCQRSMAAPPRANCLPLRWMGPLVQTA